MLKLDAQTRTNEKPEAIRALGMIPAVFYGFGKETTAISVPAVPFIKLLREAGETTAVTLSLGKESIPVLIHDVQQHPISGEPVHVDFLVVDMKKEAEVAVPLEFTGVAEIEKSGLGIVVKVMHELEVRALPADLPHSIIVDISGLATTHDAIHAKDIALPKGVTLVTEADEVIAAATGLSEEKEEAPATVDFSAIEVEKKGKKEEEDAAA
jgi:large subunit ribosomal protein L25